MFELLTGTPALLRRNHIVHFDDQWPDGTGKRDRWFKVTGQDQFKYDVARNIASGATIDLTFEDISAGIDHTHLALQPVSSDTLYEILLGFKTNSILVYPYFRNQFVHSLEASNVVPVVAEQTTRPFRERRYLGFWEPEDSPYEEPRIREHVVAKQEPPVLRLYNDDSALADRIVFRFIVNRCTLEEIPEPRDAFSLEHAREPQYVPEYRRRR